MTDIVNAAKMALEEAAKVCEENDHLVNASHLAAAIRAMKE